MVDQELDLGPNPNFISRYRRDFGKRAVVHNVQKGFQIPDLMDASGSLLQKTRITMEYLAPTEPSATPSLRVTFYFQRRASALVAAKQILLDQELYFSVGGALGQWRYLPRVLAQHIASFMPECYCLKARFAIHYPPTFPIGNRHRLRHDFIRDGRPHWEFLGFETNVEILPALLQAYFLYKTRVHNEIYSMGTNWSPAYGLRQDILIFFIRIHHFEEIVAYRESL